LNSCCVLQNYYGDQRDKTVFQNTIPDLQDEDQDKTDFLVSVRSFPKTDGLRPHHCHVPRSRTGAPLTRAREICYDLD